MKFLKKHKNLIIVIAYLLISFFVIYQVLSDPLFGIANNGDFQRFSQKFGVDYKENPWESGNYYKYFWNFVIGEFKVIEPVETGFFSTHELLGKISVSIANVFSQDGDYNIRYMGLVNAVFYLFGVGLLLSGLKNKALKEILILSVFAIFFFIDKEIVQFFNSFYTEPGSIIYFIIYVGLNLFYTRIPRKSNSLRVITLVLEAFVIFMFLNTKLQNILGIIPMMTLFGTKIFLELREKCKTGVYAVFLSILLSFLFILLPSIFSFSRSTESSNNLVSYNVIMMEMFDLSVKPTEHLLKMGLSEDNIAELEKGIGHNAYSNSELFEKYSSFFDRKQQVKIFFREPILIFKLFYEQGENLFTTISYGNFAGNLDIDTKEVSTQFSNIKILRDSLYIKNLYFLIFVLSVYIVVILRKFRERRVEKSLYENLLLLSLPIYIVLFFVTSVLGDSGHEIVKHMYLLNLIFDVIVLYLFYHFIIGLPKLWKSIKYERK